MIYQITPIQVNVIGGLAGKSPDDIPALFAKLFSAIIGLLLVGATIFAFVQLLLGGMEWISSGGDKHALENAQSRLTNALLGLFLVFASWALYLLILRFLGVTGTGATFEFKLPTLF